MVMAPCPSNPTARQARSRQRHRSRPGSSGNLDNQKPSRGPSPSSRRDDGARLSAEQRRALELLAREPRGVTGHLLVIAYGFEVKMLAGLVHEGLVAAVVGESTKAGGKAIEAVRFWITAAGRRALETRPTTAG
jgi:hypothetical protein